MADIDFILHGVDTTTGTYMAWESRTFAPQYVVASLNHVRDAVTRLSDGLPHFGGGRSNVAGEDVVAEIGGGLWNADDELDSEISAALGAEAYAGDERDRKGATAIAELRELSDQAMLTARADDFVSEIMQSLVDALQLQRFLEGLRNDIEKARRSGDRIVLAVNPPASCGQVPWELIPTGRKCEDGTREVLLDIVDVVTMAPILARDGNPQVPHPAWRPGGGVYLIQPWIDLTLPLRDKFNRRHFTESPVITIEEEESWREEVAGLRDDSVLPPNGLANRCWLSTVLREDRTFASRDNRNKKITRLVYVGHMAGMGTSSSLMLNDSERVFGMAERTAKGFRPFSAIDMTANTAVWREEYYRRSNAAAAARREASKAAVGLAEDDSNGLASVRSLASEPRWDKYHLPEGVLVETSDGQHALLHVEGEDLWPMPPRVGLVACHSGAEASQVEPYGMVTACLEAGAELVLATRWTMLTDAAFIRIQFLRESASLPQQTLEERKGILTRIRQRWGPKGPFYELARAVDTWLQSEDPIGDMHAWKRSKLAAWREDASDPRNSPITWAGVTAYRAPDRTVRD